MQFSDFYKDLLSVSTNLPDGFFTKEKSEKYYIHINELIEIGKLFNLTSVFDPAEAVRKHIVDSLFAAKVVSEISNGNAVNIIDIGSGGGFPALPIAIACDNISVTALDSTEKKCSFISSVAEKCQVNVETVPMRAEEALDMRREAFDFVTARAVAKLNVLIELCAPFVKIGGYFIAMKGSAAEEEMGDAKCAASLLGLTFDKAERYEIEGGGERIILVYKKTARTPAEYPRRFAQIKKKPL